MSTHHFNVLEHTVPATFIRHHRRATIDNDDTVVLAVKQYKPKTLVAENHQVITVIGAHANAFPKELYQPLWDDLYEVLSAQNIHIGNIFIADVASQGHSGVLNESILGNDPSWMDHPRDLFLMINHFRNDIKGPLIGIGHSMGGNNLVNLSLIHPRLFASLILVDPVMQPAFTSNVIGPARLSVKRRDQWLNRQAATEAFAKSKFYQSWDPRVLDMWIKYGLKEVEPSSIGQHRRPDISQPVELTTTRDQEVLSFVRVDFHKINAAPRSQQQSQETAVDDVNLADFFSRPEITKTFEKLPDVQPSVLYIHGGKSPISPPEIRTKRYQTTGIGSIGSGGHTVGRVKETVFDDAGHLIPMEYAKETAREISEWIVPEVRQWHQAEELATRDWIRLPREAKAKLGTEAETILRNGRLPSLEKAKEKL